MFLWKKPCVTQLGLERQTVNIVRTSQPLWRRIYVHTNTTTSLLSLGEEQMESHSRVFRSQGVSRPFPLLCLNPWHSFSLCTCRQACFSAWRPVAFRPDLGYSPRILSPEKWGGEGPSDPSPQAGSPSCLYLAEDTLVLDSFFFLRT